MKVLYTARSMINTNKSTAIIECDEGKDILVQCALHRLRQQRLTKTEFRIRTYDGQLNTTGEAVVRVADIDKILVTRKILADK